MSVRLTTGDGLELEGQIDGPDAPRAVLVLCHPHPQMGGTMNAPLLEALVEDLVPRGWTVLRFNFRGIGASEGTSGTGVEELRDAEAALEEAGRRWPELPLAIGGWSFGAAVAVKVASGRSNLIGCVAIAPAVRAKPGITAGLPDPSEVDLLCPGTFVVGANDTVTLPEDARTWAEAAGVDLIEIPGANHLFWGRYEQLSSTVAEILEAMVNEGGEP